MPYIKVTRHFNANVHSGWVTSAKLRQTLISYVARELNTTYKSAVEDPALHFPSPDAIDRAIKTGFTKLDNEIVHESVKKVRKAQSKIAAAELLAPTPCYAFPESPVRALGRAAAYASWRSAPVESAPAFGDIDRGDVRRLVEEAGGAGWLRPDAIPAVLAFNIFQRLLKRVVGRSNALGNAISASLYLSRGA